MGWESRGGKARFYIRNKKVNGRIVHEYFGSGEKARQAAPFFLAIDVGEFRVVEHGKDAPFMDHEVVLGEGR